MFIQGYFTLEINSYFIRFLHWVELVSHFNNYFKEKILFEILKDVLGFNIIILGGGGFFNLNFLK